MNSGKLQVTIAADHPAFTGHFPGIPIVPGVVLLSEALHAMGALTGFDLSVCHINTVKFLSPVRPHQAVTVDYEILSAGSLRFDMTSDGRKVATGSIRLQAGHDFG